MSENITNTLNDFIRWSVDIYNSHISINENDDSNKIYIGTYFSTQIDYSKSIVNLIKSKSYVAIPPVFRSLLEAHIDLINLCHHNDYHLILIGINIQQEIRDLKNLFKEPDNPFLAHSLKEEKNIGSEIKELKSKLNTIKGLVNKKYDDNIFQIRKRFELAGMGPTYNSIYRTLCSHTHNDLYRVETRHLDITDKEKTVHLENQWNITDVRAPIITLPGVIISSLQQVFDKFSIDKEDTLYDKRDEVVKRLESPLQLTHA